MIRTAALADIAALVEMGERMHAESLRQSRFVYRPEKVSSLLYNFITSGSGIVLVATRDEVLIGCAVAFIAAEWYSDAEVAHELVLFVDREHRGTSAAARLIAGMDAWAKAKGVAMLDAGSSTGCNPEMTAKLYERLGFTRSSIGLERFYGAH